MVALPAQAVIWVPIEHPSGIDRLVPVEFLPVEIEKPLEAKPEPVAQREQTAEELKLAELQDLINQLRALIELLQAQQKYETTNY